MKTYYTEYPRGQFSASSDNEALKKTKALLVYTESDTFNGTPFKVLRDLNWTITDEDSGQMRRQLSDAVYEFTELDGFDGEVQAIINMNEYPHEVKAECLAAYGYKWNGVSFVDTMGGIVPQWIIAEYLFECRYFV